MSYEILDHTADLMVEVRAPTLPMLFAEAARAMFDLLAEPGSARAKKKLSVRLTAENREQLLVSWLTELLFRHETGQWLFSRFEIRSLSDTRIDAEAWGEKLDPRRHGVEREIKAVTYHRLRLVEEEGGLKTTIVFDL